MIQGSHQSIICSYVFDELPHIYKLVCANKPKKIEGHQKPKKTATKPVVKCEQCKFKSSMIQMKMHMKSIHGPRPKRVSKRLPNFTPVAKPSKRSKAEIDLKMDSEGIIDDNSILMMDNTFSGKEAPLDENIALSDNMSVESPDKTVKKEGGSKEATVEINPLFSCVKCEYDCETDKQLEMHIRDAHEANDCLNCTFNSDDDTVLKDHGSECNVKKISKTNNEEPKNKETNDIQETEIEDNNQESSVICGVCNSVFLSISECEEHMKVHPATCYRCDFQSDDQNVLNNHEFKEHMYRKCKPGSHEGKCKKICEKNEHSCDDCKKTFKSNEELRNHIQTHSSAPAPSSPLKDQTDIQCDQCSFIAENVSVFVNHIIKSHENSFEICNLCGYVATTGESLKSHIKDNHDDQELLNVISGQISQVTKSFDIFEVFKKELKDVLNTFIGGHNSILQELFVIRNNQANETKFKNIEDSITKLTTMVSESLSIPRCADTVTNPTISFSAPPPVTASVPIPNQAP